MIHKTNFFHSIARNMYLEYFAVTSYKRFNTLILKSPNTETIETTTLNTISKRLHLKFNAKYQQKKRSRRLLSEPSTREFTLSRSVNSHLGQVERLPSKSRSKPCPRRVGILQMNPTFSPASQGYPERYSLASLGVFAR